MVAMFRKVDEHESAHYSAFLSQDLELFYFLVCVVGNNKSMIDSTEWENIFDIQSV